MTSRSNSLLAISSVVRRSGVAVFLAALIGLVAASPARASVVERIVAVVGDKPILLSDLRIRARPYLVQIAASSHTAAEATAQESKMFSELLTKLIDERLEQAAAERSRLGISEEEVDQGLSNVATQAKLSVRELVDEARKSGLSEQEYREEIRRQLLDGKLIQLRVRGRVRPTDDDARAIYTRVVREMGGEPPVDVRMIALRLGTPASGALSPEQVLAREALAGDIVQRARKGEDFCTLVAKYSDDSETNATCGSRGSQPLVNVMPEIQPIVRSLEPGQVADPIRFGDQAIIVVQLAARQKIPEFDEVRESMLNRAFTESLERQRKVWLAELRRQTYVDVRY